MVRVTPQHARTDLARAARSRPSTASNSYKNASPSSFPFRFISIALHNSLFPFTSTKKAFSCKRGFRSHLAPVVGDWKDSVSRASWSREFPDHVGQQGEFPAKGLLHATAAEAGHAATGFSGDDAGADVREEADVAGGREGSLPHHSQGAPRRLPLRQGQEGPSENPNFFFYQLSWFCLKWIDVCSFS